MGVVITFGDKTKHYCSIGKAPYHCSKVTDEVDEETGEKYSEWSLGGCIDIWSCATKEETGTTGFVVGTTSVNISTRGEPENPAELIYNTFKMIHSTARDSE